MDANVSAFWRESTHRGQGPAEARVLDSVCWVLQSNILWHKWGN